MILSLFFLLLGLSFALVVIGLWKTEHSELAIIGFFFIFLLSFTILNSQLEIKTGENITYVYGNNFTGYHWDYDEGQPNNPQNEPFIFHKNINYNYEKYGSHQLGYWLLIGSAFGMIIMFVSIKRTNWRKDNE